VPCAGKGIDVRALIFRTPAFRALGTVAIGLSVALAGGVTAAPSAQVEAPACEGTTSIAQADPAVDAKTEVSGETSECTAESPAAAKPAPDRRLTFEELMERREVVPLNTRGYNYKRPDEIRGEVPSTHSVPPPGVPARRTSEPASAQ
jgi:hypothetical protein